MFTQNMAKKPIRDFVFPVGNVVDNHFLLRGTAFFIGDKGIAVTAAHVIDQMLVDDDGNTHKDPSLVGLFIDSAGQWVPVDINSYEKHKTDDIALLRMDGDFWSIFQITPSRENCGREYDLWGYPERVAHEIRAIATNPVEAEFLVSPDLIYGRSYIRRRISRPLRSILYRGESFYELGEVAGACCSGSPIVARPLNPGNPLQVIGIYIGEETSGQPPVGYALRCDAIESWLPEMTGQLLKHLPAVG